MKNKNAAPLFALALVFAAAVAGCDILNPVVDDWWHGEPGGGYLFEQETFYVTFDSGGGEYVDSINGNSPSASPQRVWAHTRVSVPGLVTKEDSFFKGWYKTQGGSVKWDFTTDEADLDNDKFGGAAEDNIITLYAQWIDSGDPGYLDGRTVDFDINFPGEASGFNPAVDLTYTPEQESIANGAFAAEPLQFGIKPDTRFANKYVFTGWYKNDTAADDPLGHQIDKWDFAIDTVTQDVTLHAGWVEIGNPAVAYTVTFVSAADKNLPPKQYVISGEPVIAPYVTYRNGYSFGGWYKDAACTDDWDFAADTVTKNEILYAKWAPAAVVDILKDVDIIKSTFILFSGGQSVFNGTPAPGSSTDLTSAERTVNDEEINNIVALLDANTHYRVMVVGHANPATAADRADPQNPELMKLSGDRADAVKAEIEYGLDALSSQYDYDEKTPIVARAEGGRRALENPMLSRRVEMIVFDIITKTVTQ